MKKTLTPAQKGQLINLCDEGIFNPLNEDFEIDMSDIDEDDEKWENIYDERLTVFLKEALDFMFDYLKKRCLSNSSK